MVFWSREGLVLEVKVPNRQARDKRAECWRRLSGSYCAFTVVEVAAAGSFVAAGATVETATELDAGTAATGLVATWAGVVAFLVTFSASTTKMSVSFGPIFGGLPAAP
jgi:hypothetical protein